MNKNMRVHEIIVDYKDSEPIGGVSFAEEINNFLMTIEQENGIIIDIRYQVCAIQYNVNENLEVHSALILYNEKEK